LASLALRARFATAVQTSALPTSTGVLTNTVTVSAANDTNPANNTATDTDTLTPQCDVSVTKSDGITTVTAGDGVVRTYTITVTKIGRASSREGGYTLAAGVTANK